MVIAILTHSQPMTSERSIFMAIVVVVIMVMVVILVMVFVVALLMVMEVVEVLE